jgi:hypothetical protein
LTDGAAAVPSAPVAAVPLAADAADAGVAVAADGVTAVVVRSIGSLVILIVAVSGDAAGVAASVAVDGTSARVNSSSIMSTSVPIVVRASPLTPLIVVACTFVGGVVSMSSWRRTLVVPITRRGWRCKRANEAIGRTPNDAISTPLLVRHNQMRYERRNDDVVCDTHGVYDGCSVRLCLFLFVVGRFAVNFVTRTVRFKGNESIDRSLNPHTRYHPHHHPLSPT